MRQVFVKRAGPFARQIDLRERGLRVAAAIATISSPTNFDRERAVHVHSPCGWRS